MDNYTKIVFLFSGQGSQYRGMGYNLFKTNRVFRNSIEESDALVRRLLHRSLIDELYGKNDLPFEDVLITHPAIVAVEVAMNAVMMDMHIQPYYVGGSSLGEFSAAVAGEVWSAEAAIEAAVEQAKAIVRTDKKGGMIAVVSQRSGCMEDLYNRHHLFLASDNFDGHFTLSGKGADIDRFETALKSLDISFFRLPVAFPFHSPLIREGENEFIRYINSRSPLAKPATAFISGTQAAEMRCLSGSYFWEAVTAYSSFPQVVDYMESSGPCFYIDLGPSGTSANFVKYNLKPQSHSKTFQVMNLFRREEEGLSKLQKLLHGQPNPI